MPSTSIASLAEMVGLVWTDYQVAAYDAALDLTGPAQRLCLYYKTGAGKTITSLVSMTLWEQTSVLVLAPPATHHDWLAWGRRLGIEVQPISHAKFRQKNFRVSRDRAMIVDEFHLLGGHNGVGWLKLDRIAMGLQAPMILMSATPNYNDADRVYCIQHILDPAATRGGFLEFIYKHCTTEQNPFGMMPIVTGFQHYKDAAGFLAALPHVQYLADDLVYTIVDVPVPTDATPELDRFGYSRRTHRIMASGMEERHHRVFLGLVGEDGLLRDEAFKVVMDLVARSSTPVLVYSVHSTVAEALVDKLNANAIGCDYVNGSTTTKNKARKIQQFRDGNTGILVGTASLATGTDGFDKVCDTLIILDDTDDAAHRRQLIGRIMPRGLAMDASKKHVYRLCLT